MVLKSFSKPTLLILAADSSFATYNLLSKVLVRAELNFKEGLDLAALALETKPSPYHELATIYLYYAVPEHTLELVHLR
ncbi:hypothetical protein MJD09_17100 [bacterium]|nr:hypothetical protein [bacterium]